MCVYELFVQVKSPEAEYMLQGLPEFRHFSTCNTCKIKDRLTVEFYYSSIYLYPDEIYFVEHPNSTRKQIVLLRETI
jgi:hypothetical protein